HRYRDDGVYTISLSWRDPQGAGNSATLEAVVRNVPPVVTAGPDTRLRAGGVLNRVGSFSDPGADVWTATVDYGDGSATEPLKLDRSGHFRLHHKYRVAGTYEVTVSVADDDRGVGSDTFVVTVAGAAPAPTRGAARPSAPSPIAPADLADVVFALLGDAD